MSPYKSYMKAFGTDIRRCAVWEPGRYVAPGDYGKIEDGLWLRLGSIWDMVPRPPESFSQTHTSRQEVKTIGSAEVTSSHANVGGASISLAIKFKAKNSVFGRAAHCETKSLKDLQSIADWLVAAEVWDPTWTLVSEVTSAKSFLVLVCTSDGGSAIVNANTADMSQSFLNGTLSADVGIEINGAGVLKYVGRSGPIHMSLVRLKSPNLIRKRTSVKNVEFAEGHRQQIGPEPTYVEIVQPLSLISDQEGANNGK